MGSFDFCKKNIVVALCGLIFGICYCLQLLPEKSLVQFYLISRMPGDSSDQ